MDMLGNLLLGLHTAITPANLLFCFLGTLIGTLIGVLPGISPLTTVALLLPFTFGLAPETSLIMLAGIFYGAQYGGSTSAILVNIPGETSAVVSCLDGHQMARAGRAGPALAIAALASFGAGTIGTLIVATLSVPLATLGLKFQAAEYFSLLLLGLLAAVAMSRGSIAKSVAMLVFGVLLGLVGTDVNSGASRLSFGLPMLADGLSLAPIAIGSIGVAEMIANLGNAQSVAESRIRVGSMMPSRDELRRMLPAMLRGTGLGAGLGILPGGGAALASFASYALEKQVSAHPERFGTGKVEGLAGPEAANNAAAQTSFIPMLTLGLPSNGLMAVMIGALMIQGIQPGPSIIVEQPTLFWGVIVSMWIGNAMLLALNLPLAPAWALLLRVPYRVLFPLIVMMCCVGAYSTNNSTFDVWLMLLSAVAGFLFVCARAEPAPLLLGFVLGPQLEENFRRAMRLADGDIAVFLSRPISAVLLAAAVLAVVLAVTPVLRRGRERVFAEE